MKRILIIIIIIFLLLCLAIGGCIYWQHMKLKEQAVSQNPPSSAGNLKLYTNDAYKYSFQYPSPDTIYEYTSEIVSVGIADGQNFSSSVDISVESADPGETFPVTVRNFSEYAHYRAQVYCSADGPHVSINCTGVSRTEPFITQDGLTGEKVYFNLKRMTSSGAQSSSDSNPSVAIKNTSTTTEVGPVYIFNISSSSPDKLYTALIIRNQLAGDSVAPEDAALAEAIAHSFSLENSLEK